MALYKRKKTWWITISHGGQRIQRSTGTSNRVAAQEFHDKFKSELWSISKLNSKPIHSWRDAVIRWLRENQDKRSIETDKIHLRWLDPHWRQLQLHEIDRDVIENVALLKEEEEVTPTTVNRILEVIRAILRKAKIQWEWLDDVPVIRMRKIEKHRIRWLSYEEAARLLVELPSHLSDMAAFTLATGLRASNVTGLKWRDVDLERQHAWIHPDQAKTKKAIPVPLNENAMLVLKEREGKHPEYVFSYMGHPIGQCNTKAWTKALARAGIKNFRWHDLRHTWASWHVQNGTTLQELQLLGGWSNLEMVLRYAHLSSAHLRSAADRIGSIELREN